MKREEEPRGERSVGGLGSRELVSVLALPWPGLVLKMAFLRVPWKIFHSAVFSPW